MKYIAKINITFALKSGKVIFEKGKEIDSQDAKDFKSRTSADIFKKYVTEEIQEVAEITPKIEAKTEHVEKSENVDKKVSKSSNRRKRK